MSDQQLNLFGNSKSSQANKPKKPFALRHVSDKGIKYFAILKKRGVDLKLSIYPAGICQSIYLTILTTNTLLSKKTDKTYTHYSNSLNDKWIYRLDDNYKPHHLTLSMLKDLVNESDPNNHKDKAKNQANKDDKDTKESTKHAKSTTKSAK